MYQPLVPDDAFLSAVFPNAKPSSVDILANSAFVCTFKVHIDTGPYPAWSKDLVVRMETSSGRLEAVRDLQDIARLQIPEPVPETYALGKVAMADDKEVE